jgi:hypothetical protein
MPDAYGEQLAAWGKVVLLETTGRDEELDGADRARAITELILKYGTPAESLGAGPAFRLRPAG